MNTRRQNEKKFGKWENLPDGGRRYWYDVKGHRGQSARYIKEVDSEEKTIRFYQEIYDNHGKLIEIHLKYPKDEGHIEIKDSRL
ncbi:MAG: hypothetical protein AB1546_04975 [bacterium]